MHHLRQRQAIRRLEVGALRVGDWEEPALRHLLVRDAEEFSGLLLAVVHQVDRRPRRADATVAQREHEAPRGRQERSPCTGTHRHVDVLETTLDARDHQIRRTLEVLREERGRVAHATHLRIALVASRAPRQARVDLPVVAIDVGEGLLLGRVLDDDEVPALTVASRRCLERDLEALLDDRALDRKSTRLNSSH